MKGVKDEIILFGGELDGLTLSVSDSTFSWPFALCFEMLLDDGQKPTGSDQIASNIVKVRKIRYSVMYTGEEPNGDAFAQYLHDGNEDCQYDFNQYANDPSEPFHPDNFPKE